VYVREFLSAWPNPERCRRQQAVYDTDKHDHTQPYILFLLQIIIIKITKIMTTNYGPPTT